MADHDRHSSKDILQRTLILVQLACLEIVPAKLVEDLTTDILALGSTGPEHRKTLQLCINALELALPQRPMLAAERFLQIRPEAMYKKRGRKH